MRNPKDTRPAAGRLSFLAVFLSILWISAGPIPAGAEEESLDYAQVLFVRVVEQEDGRLRFEVTVRHHDTGWDHYADAWQIIDPAAGEQPASQADAGALIAERILAHPHVQEQPFTRSLAGVALAPGTERVLIRAKCNRHGFGGKSVLVDLAPGHREDHQVIRP